MKHSCRNSLSLSGNPVIELGENTGHGGEKPAPCRPPEGSPASFHHPGNYSAHTCHHMPESFCSELLPKPIYYQKHYESAKRKRKKLNCGTFI